MAQQLFKFGRWILICSICLLLGMLLMYSVSNLLTRSDGAARQVNLVMPIENDVNSLIDPSSNEKDSGKMATIERTTPIKSQADIERDRKNKTEAWNDLLRAHAEQPEDKDWATNAERAISDDLARMANEMGFTLVHAECKSNTCVADMTWSSYDAAVQRLGDVVTRMLSVNCKQRMMLPEPPQNEFLKPYSSSLYFDCSRWKANGSIINPRQ